MADGATKNAVKPYIPAGTTLAEITPRAIVLGVFLSALLAGANAYLGLKVGLTVSASIPAAVISMAILRMFRNSNILENNIVQTAASAGESLAAGVIFTLPALILLEYWADFRYYEVMGIAAVGGILGVLFTIPLRRALIIEGGLRFPEGIATGEVLKAGTEGGRGVRHIAMGALGAAFLKVCQTGFKLVAPSVGGAVPVGRSLFGMGSDLSPALLAVGYIVGLNIAILVFAGGCISWLLGIPIYTAMNGLPEGSSGGLAEAYGAALNIWSTKIRYMGVGAMVVGGVWALVSLVKPIRDGVASSIAAFRSARAGGGAQVLRTERDMPIPAVGLGLVGMILPLVLVYRFILSADALGVGSGTYWTVVVTGVVFALVAGFVFSSVAGYMAGLVGSSNNPISGVTIATVLTTSLILLFILSGEVDFATADAARTAAAAAAAILVGGVVCCAAAIAGDNMQDLKAGQIVGATPYKQQIMQVVGVLAAALTLGPVLSLLFQAYGLGGFFPRPGMDPNEMLSAPQATLMQSVAQGVFSRNLEWTMIAIGGGIAVAIIALDKLLEARGSDFRAPVLAVAVGIYLPVELSVPIFIGGVVAALSARAHKDPEARKAGGQRGLLFSSGLITGEALLGILLAIPFAAAQSTDVLKLAPDGFETVATALGLLSITFLVVWMYKVAARARD